LGQKDQEVTIGVNFSGKSHPMKAVDVTHKVDHAVSFQFLPKQLLILVTVKVEDEVINIETNLNRLMGEEGTLGEVMKL
jgi:hypothetical protein